LRQAAQPFQVIAIAIVLVAKRYEFLVATFCDSLNNILRINCPLPPAAPILWTIQIQFQHHRSHLGSARTDIACELVLQESDCNF